MNPLLTARQRRNMSQQDLAVITGYSRQMIQRYEAGRSNTPPVELCAFYDEAAGVSLGTHARSYVEYIEERRSKLPLSELKGILSPYKQGSVIIPNSAMRQMREAIMEYSDVRPTAAKKAGSLSNEYFISATMHVHPYSLQKWQTTGHIPSVILDIVSGAEAGQNREEDSYGQVAQED